MAATEVAASEDPTPSATIVGILLAAGAGSRFGGAKLMQLLADGVPVGVASLRNLSAALGRVTAVVREGDDALGKMLEENGAKVVWSRDAWKGMGHSLADAIRSSSTAAGWVVALGDMPAIAPATITAVARRLQQGADIVVPVFGDERGHPVGLSAAHRDALLQCDGDEGARALLRREADRIVKIVVDDPGILRDIDTRADLEAMGRLPSAR